MKRHLYQSPKGTCSSIFSAAGGILAALAVFVTIPLSQKLNGMIQKSTTYAPDVATVEPPEIIIEEPPPPPEPKPDPPPQDPPIPPPPGIDPLPVLQGDPSGNWPPPQPPVIPGPGDPEDPDSPPTPVNKPLPAYPSSLLEAGIGGRVLVTCSVDDTGNVTEVSIHQSSGHPELDKAATDAVNKWKFKPAFKAGRKVKSTCVIPYRFEMKRN